MNSYSETIEFLTHSLPAYHRIGAAAYKANLDSTLKMMEHLHHPEEAFPAIHVAGTNGKGSVSHMLASVLHRAGLKVGLYTSPHLVDFRERIRIDGKKIEESYVVEFVERNKSFFVESQLSFFEMTVGMAFDYFASRQVDVAVVEVGMGGRLDSTNVVHSMMSVITNIGFDHTQFLGDTLAKIAVEKAGIIKKGVPVVIGETHPETAPVFSQKAREEDSPILFADAHYVCKKHIETSHVGDRSMLVDVECDGRSRMELLETPLCGSYQYKNIATLFAAIDTLNARQLQLGGNQLKIDDASLRDGLAHVLSDTGFHGRWEVLEKSPTIVCETAHNIDGVNQLIHKLQDLGLVYDGKADPRLHIIYGCVNDKDYGTILDVLPAGAHYYYTRPSVERGLDAEKLSQSAEAKNRVGEAYENVEEALCAARKSASDEDVILITGSIFLVADLLRHYHIE